MENNNYKLEIPTERLDMIIDKSIKRGTTYKRNLMFKRVAITCLLVGGVASINLAQPTFAENVPIIGTVFQKINSTLGINKDPQDYMKYAQVINKSTSNNNVQVKVTEAILDSRKNLILSYEIKNEKGFSVDDFKFTEEISAAVKLEGIKRASFHPDYNSSYEKASKQLSAIVNKDTVPDLTEGEGIVTGKFIDEHTFIGKSEYDLSSFTNIPGTFKIKLNIDELGFYTGKSLESSDQKLIGYTKLNKVDGKWDLEFEVKMSDLKEVTAVEINDSTEDLVIHDIVISPFTLDINARVDFRKISKLKVVDENNKEYTNYNTINKKENDSKFTDITFRYLDIGKDVKSLKIIFLTGDNIEVYSKEVPIVK